MWLSVCVCVLLKVSEWCSRTSSGKWETSVRYHSLATVRLDTWKTFAQTAGAKSLLQIGRVLPQTLWHLCSSGTSHLLLPLPLFLPLLHLLQTPPPPVSFVYSLSRERDTDVIFVQGEPKYLVLQESLSSSPSVVYFCETGEWKKQLHSNDANHNSGKFKRRCPVHLNIILSSLNHTISPLSFIKMI